MKVKPYASYMEAFDAMNEEATARLEELRQVLKDYFPTCSAENVEVIKYDDHWLWEFRFYVEHPDVKSAMATFQLWMLDAQVESESGEGQIGFRFEAEVSENLSKDGKEICSIQLYNYSPKVWVPLSDPAAISQRLSDTLDAINAENFPLWLAGSDAARFFPFPPREDEKAENILKWLNDRAIGTISVLHKGKAMVIWNVDDARNEGLTIEEAVLQFADEHRIDIAQEVGEP